MLELGRKLTKELDLDGSVDTLGRWMAHYVAELIHAAENSSTEDRPAKMHACSEAIFALWRHRHELPNGNRPFEKLESTLRALESLDPDNGTPRYFRSIQGATKEANDDSEARPWLKLIDGLDYSAKLLIRYCLAKAATSTLDRSAEWISLAEAAGANDDIEFSIVRLIYGEQDLLRASDLDEAKRKQLEDRISRLEGFTRMANTLAAELRQQVQQTQEVKSGPS